MAHLAQINIGRLLAPIDDPKIMDFVAQLDEVNLLAERSHGFIWRLKSNSGNATELVFNEDPLVIVNMSVWDSIESLKQFSYSGRHLQVFRNRQNWFEKMTLAHYCLWWIPDGHLPSVKEGRERLECYQKNGATEQAFWFSQLFPAPLFESVSA